MPAPARFSFRPAHLGISIAYDHTDRYNLIREISASINAHVYRVYLASLWKVISAEQPEFQDAINLKANAGTLRQIRWRSIYEMRLHQAIRFNRAHWFLSASHFFFLHPFSLDEKGCKKSRQKNASHCTTLHTPAFLPGQRTWASRLPASKLGRYNIIPQRMLSINDPGYRVFVDFQIRTHCPITRSVSSYGYHLKPELNWEALARWHGPKAGVCEHVRKEHLFPIAIGIDFLYTFSSKEKV